MKFGTLVENISAIAKQAKQNGISMSELGEMDIVEYNLPRNGFTLSQSIKLTLSKTANGQYKILQTDYGEKHDVIMRRTRRSY